MFNTSFNNNFQNTVPNSNTNTNPYQDQYFGRGDQTPYIQGMNPALPGNDMTMMGNNEQNYPLQPSTATPYLDQPNGYAEGGSAKSTRKSKKQQAPNLYPSLAEMIRQQGEGEDTILAHINPLEAHILGLISGGDINKTTGLPQFGLFDNPKKWFKSVIGPTGGAILGNMILPGIGGIIGGGLGGAAGSAARGRKDYGQAALRGAAMGSMIPTGASILGSGASALGAKGAGAALSNYGSKNAIIPAAERLFGLDKGAASGMMPGGKTSSALAASMLSNRGGSAPQYQNELIPRISGVSAGDDYEDYDRGGKKGKRRKEESFLDTLMGKSKDFLTDPANLLATASTIGSFMNRPKKEKAKTPEQIADEKKRLDKHLMLSPKELAEREAYELAEEQMRRRIARKKFLPEERLGPIDPVYRKSHTPDEYANTGKWLSYYNNPQFTGNPINFKEGGYSHPSMNYEMEEMNYPSERGFFLEGHTGGQDDKIPALLSDGEYVIDASTVANLGDGNNTAGARKLDKMIMNIRKHKGGSTKLPPKAKSLANYIRG